MYIGLMSGTSMDAIDAVLASFDENKVTLIGTASTPITLLMKTKLMTLCRGENISLRLLGETETQLGHLFADTCLQLLDKTGIKSSEITAIGSHGQTIYHHPNGDNPFSLQIGDPNVIAARTNITTVADFRRRDVALGGQGAPLVPAFHHYLFGRTSENQGIINIGGIANVTYLPSDYAQSILGFDTGPGNTLLDCWHEQHREKSVDLNGEWARSGKLNHELLAHFLNDPYFQKSFPKSTGREYFNSQWLDEKLKLLSHAVSPVDIQNTLTELTAKSIADAINKIFHTLWVCGGGAYNTFLMERLCAHCPHVQINSTQKIGIDPQWIEATAFAWLAKQTIEKKAGNCMSVTGAKKESILGAVYFS